MPLLPGTRFGRYDIRSKIGEGGMGEVYLAHDAALGRPVALKVLLPGLQDDGQLARFEHEACAASALNHPNILTIYEFAEHDGLHYIAAEFVDGISLREWLKRAGGRLTIADVVEVGRQIAGAVAAAHQSNIVHRDLKPENVVVRTDGYVKVLDFGLAKRVDATHGSGDLRTAMATMPGTILGTALYMSPEQARGLPVDARADVWSFGCVMYEMVAGRSPFEGNTAVEILAAVLTRDPVPVTEARPECPPALAVLIEGMLVKDRQARQESMASVHRALAQIARDLSRSQTAPADQPPASERTSDGERAVAGERGPGALVAGLAGIAAIVVLVASLWPRTLTPEAAGTQSAATARPEAAAAASADAGRSLEFWLTVQRVRDGRAYQQPFDSTGREIFENGWKFRVHARSQQSGSLYLLNEGPDAGGRTTLRFLFPLPEGERPAAFAPDAPIESPWYRLTDHPGTEKFWIVWSKDPVPSLEAARRLANPSDLGLITDVRMAIDVSNLLQQRGVQADTDYSRKRSIARSASPVLAHVLRLEHQ